ncbi:MAG: divalent cation tolerance protein CutA, partial [Candidatus Aenigmatarchaeota archaeon]|nr:divalent-cation tolerance protein CutA [Candidatus Aenigmarchaeota archaeon]
MQLLITTISKKKVKEVKKALSEKLAACILEIDSNSSFLWQGKIEEEKESILVFKTSDEKIEELKRFVEKNHPYTTPFIACFDLKNVNEKYRKWLKGVL